MNYENITQKFDESELKCLGCGKPITAGSFCEKCLQKKFKKSLSADELIGTEKANRKHQTPNKRVM